LIQALNDQNEKVRGMAAMALGGIGEPAKSAVWALIPMLNGESKRIRDFTAQALEAIGTVEARSALNRYRW
jgi:HEAT repeat protein